LPIVPLTFQGYSAIEIELDVHGTRIHRLLLVDTGFTATTGCAIKIPTQFAAFTQYRYTCRIRVADGREVAAHYIPDGIITEISGRKTAMMFPTLFMDGPEAIGAIFLQQCRLELDGPRGVGALHF
jgi:hypothetical protein